MKSIRDHMMFILPLLVILFGVEFFLVFNRVTNDYEEQLKNSYTILVISKRPISASELKSVDSEIDTVAQIPKEKIVKDIRNRIKHMDIEAGNSVVAKMPYFFSLRLKRYLGNEVVDRIKREIEQLDGIKSVETFGQDHNSKYKLFMFIKLTFWSFVGIMSLVSIFLVIKQMEVWQMAHSRRIQIMEILGAPLLLRSGMLFKMGIIDAFLSVVFGSAIFISLRYYFAPKSGIEILVEKQDLLFKWWDTLVMTGVSFSIVFASVLVVIWGSKEVVE